MSQHRHAALRIAALAVLLLATPSLWAEDAKPARNAIFNGAFVEGVMGYGVLGPSHKGVTLSTDKTQHAQTLVTELIVSHPAMARTFTFYSTYLLHPRPDREYRMRVQMAGVGQFAMGAFEYDESGHHIGNNYSERQALTPEFQEFTFTYKPSKNATGLRPSIVFLEPTDGTKIDVRARLRNFELLVPAAEFSTMCKSWPDYAKDDVFASYKGFSAAELKTLQDLTKASTVLPPYRPIAHKRPADFTLTTSRLQFGQSVWPQQIAVLGQEMLARPLELRVVYGDGTRLPTTGGTAQVRATGHRADLSQQFRTGGKSLNVSLEMHYDAFLIYTLDFPATPGATLREVSLTLPLTNQTARYISYDRAVAPGAPADQGWVFGYGPVPQPGEKVENKAITGSVHMGGAIPNDWQPPVTGANGVIRQWTQDIPQLIWLGDEARGLSLVSLSAQGYRWGEGDPAVRLVHRGGEVALTYRFITQPVALDKARRLQFALQIMPPKPVRENWLAARFNTPIVGYPEIADQALPLFEERLQPGAAAAAKPEAVRPYLTAYDVIREGAVPQPWQPRPHRPFRDTGFWWYTMWAQGSRASGLPVGGCSTPLVGHPDRLRKIVKVSELLGHQGLPYFAATHIAAEDPAGYYYVEQTDDWTQHPRVPRPPYLRPTCPNSLFSAYIAQGIGKLIDEYGITGVYFDNCAPFMCTNTKHGCGYVDDNGVLQPTLPLLGFRRLFMMVRAEFVKRGKEPFILTHAAMHPGAISFIDVELQGEGTYGSDHTEMISLGEWRTRWLGPTPYGVQMSYLPAFGYGLGPNVDRAKEQVIGTPRLLAMALLHGTQVWSEYLEKPLLYRTWTVLDELDEAGVEFLPYWQWPAVNQPLNAQGVYATAYVGKERVIVVLSNLTAEDRVVTLPLAEIKCHSGAVSQIADNMHGQPVSREGGNVTCTIGAKNFRLLSFSR
jgi:hypothetical protein